MSGEGERTPKWRGEGEGRGRGRGSNNKLVVVCYSPPLPRWRSYLGHLHVPVVEGGDLIQLASGLSVTLERFSNSLRFLILYLSSIEHLCLMLCSPIYGLMSTRITLEKIHSRSL